MLPCKEFSLKCTGVYVTNIGLIIFLFHFLCSRMFALSFNFLKFTRTYFIKESNTAFVILQYTYITWVGIMKQSDKKYIKKYSVRFRGLEHLVSLLFNSSFKYIWKYVQFCAGYSGHIWEIYISKHFTFGHTWEISTSVSLPQLKDTRNMKFCSSCFWDHINVCINYLWLYLRLCERLY